MILGLGNDLCDIRRIEKSIERWGDRFIDRIFTSEEKARGERGGAASFAKRFAAKEACAKALGSGFADGVFLKDIGIVNLETGRPVLKLTGGAARKLASLTPEGMSARLDLSMTDEYPLAQAVVIISAVAAPQSDHA